MENMIPRATLPSLLWTVLNSLEQAYIDEGAGHDRMPSLDLWANLLRALNEAGTDRRQLPATLRLSKRAVRSRIASAARKQWVEELKSGRGQAAVRLTGRGRDVAARWKPLQSVAEERWRAQTGVERTAKLRVSLEDVVSMMPLEHPHYPASYGAADATITGGNGQDWKAVPRKGGDTVSHLTLSALISEALVDFAVNYEQKSPVALSLSTNVVKRIPQEGRPLQGLGFSVGIAALERHGYVRLSGTHGNDVVHLTAKGWVVRDSYDERVKAVEKDWCTIYGDKPVTALRRTLEDAILGLPRSQ